MVVVVLLMAVVMAVLNFLREHQSFLLFLQQQPIEIESDDLQRIVGKWKQMRMCVCLLYEMIVQAQKHVYVNSNSNSKTKTSMRKNML